MLLRASSSKQDHQKLSLCSKTRCDQRGGGLGEARAMEGKRQIKLASLQPARIDMRDKNSQNKARSTSRSRPMWRVEQSEFARKANVLSAVHTFLAAYPSNLFSSIRLAFSRWSVRAGRIQIHKFSSFVSIEGLRRIDRSIF